MKETSPPPSVPEFEVRCNRFVEQVKNQVVEKYPQLTFWVENETQAEQKSLQKLRKLYQQMGKEDQLPQHLIPSRLRRQKRAKEISTHTNYARIQVIGQQDTIKVFDHIFKSVQDINQVAKEHDGQRTSPTDEQLRSDVYDSIYLPGTVLIYRFT